MRWKLVESGIRYKKKIYLQARKKNGRTHLLPQDQETDFIFNFGSKKKFKVSNFMNILEGNMIYLA